MKKSIPAWLVLTVICVVAAVLLAATNLATKDVIAANAQREAMETLGKLLPDATGFETMDESGISVGKDDSGNIVGYALAATTQGFGGEVETTVAARPDGIINGISVGGSNFAETAGLGARAKEPEFQAQFAGKNAPVALTKDGGEIEALSGATITSRAVIKGVNEAMETIAGVAGFTVESTSTAEHLGEGRYAATAQGFGGPVKVFMTLDENRTITEFSVGDSQFAETAGLGARAQEEAFQSQFIGKTLPVSIGDIDAIAGATITTNAVIEAIGIVNDGLDNGLADAPITAAEEPQADEASEPETEPAQTEAEPAAETEPAQTEAEPANETEPAQTDAAPAAETGAEAGSYSASAQGFGGPVRVFLEVDENRTITGIRIGDSQFAETDGLGARAKEEAFQSQFIGKTLPLKDGDIEAIAGATVTTNAVLQAIDQINSLIPAGGAESGAAGGNYSASAQGFGGPVRVFLTVDGNKTITAIRIGDSQFAETEGLGAKAQEEAFQSQFIGKTLPLKAEEVDAITGATITTGAVFDAINLIAQQYSILTENVELDLTPYTDNKTNSSTDASSKVTGTKTKSSSTSSSSKTFTNAYGTSTTRCAHPGCNNPIASTGDTNCCTTHSRRCLECGKYIDEDASYCMDCLSKAFQPSNSKSSGSKSTGSSSSSSLDFSGYSDSMSDAEFDAWLDGLLGDY